VPALVTSQDVARVASVSRATVSRVINGSARVKPDARERVLAAIRATGYKPDVAAQELVRQQSRSIALGLFTKVDDGFSLSTIGQPGYYFYLDVLRHVEHEITDSGYDIVLPSLTRDEASPQGFTWNTRRLAGALMIALPVTDKRVQALRAAHVPTVFIDSIVHDEHMAYIRSDNVDGVRQTTAHLLALGHRRIAILSDHNTALAGLERFLGYHQAFEGAGFAVDPGLVRQSLFNMEDGYAAANALVRERPDVTAIVAASDLMAVGVRRALREHGLRVPEDISLTGFDDIELCPFMDPPLTTVRQDRVAMARGAVRLLLNLIAGTPAPSPLVVPTELVVRASTRPPPP